ncbi:MAG: hypothetical protein KBD56_07010 [Candidatus Eisenbacteria bacterium]|nr:hypothetical protein [Candidatus Eisenbacteria bacterium]
MRNWVLDILSSTLRSLVEEGYLIGNWGDVRGTADCLYALDSCLPIDSFPRLRAHAARWLVLRGLPEPNGFLSWEEEVWDTSVALLALATSPQDFSEPIRGGLRWLSKVYQRGRQNWNDEPWESSWALLAIDSAARLREPLDVDREATLRWLLTLRGNPAPAQLVNCHYTALFALVARSFVERETSADDQELIASLRTARQESTAFLANRLSQAPAGELWTREVWSNSLALWALASNEAAGALPAATLERTITWFAKELENPATVLTEDRAFAAVALFHLAVDLGAFQNHSICRAAEGLADQYQDPQIRWVADYSRRRVELEIAALVRQDLGQALSSVRDMPAHPPMITRQLFSNYYSLNLPRRPVNVIAVLAATVGITILSRYAGGSIGGLWGTILQWVPMSLGVLATIGQLGNFSLANLMDHKKGPQ